MEHQDKQDQIQRQKYQSGLSVISGKSTDSALKQDGTTVQPFTYQKQNTKSADLQKQIRRLSQIQSTASVEGIMQLDAFQENILGEHLTKINQIEDEIEKVQNAIEGLQFQFDDTKGFIDEKVEEKNKELRLLIKKMEFKCKILKDTKKSRMQQVSTIMEEKIESLYNFEEIHHKFVKQISYKGSSLFNQIELKDQDEVDELTLGKIKTKEGVAVIKNKRLNDLEKSVLGLEVDLLYAEDLTFQGIAKNYQMKKGDFSEAMKYDKIKANTKKHRSIVFDEISSISLSKDKDTDYVEEGWENDKLNAHADPNTEQSDSGSYNSCASRHNFWEDVNVGVNEGEYQDTMFREDKRKCNQTKRLEKENAQLRSAHTRMLHPDELKSKMIKLRDLYENQKATMQGALFEEVDKIFREKCRALSICIKDDYTQLLSQFYKLRLQYNNEKAKNLIAQDFVINQEYIINELRQFIEENLRSFLNVVERERPGVMAKYKPINDTLSRSKYDLNDPFKVFELYNSTAVQAVKKQPHEKVIEDLRYEINEQKKKELTMRIQVETAMKVAEILSNDKECITQSLADMKNRIKVLEIALSEEKTKAKQEIVQRDKLIKEMREKILAEREQLVKFSKLEADVASEVIAKMKTEMERQSIELHAVKNVLRIPRLYNIYQKSMKAAGDKNLMTEFAEHQLSKLATDDIIPTEEDYKQAVTKALKINFGNDFPANNMYDHILNMSKGGSRVETMASVINAVGLQGSTMASPDTTSSNKAKYDIAVLMQDMDKYIAKNNLQGYDPNPVVKKDYINIISNKNSETDIIRKHKNSTIISNWEDDSETEIPLNQQSPQQLHENLVIVTTDGINPLKSAKLRGIGGHNGREQIRINNNKTQKALNNQHRTLSPQSVNNMSRKTKINDDLDLSKSIFSARIPQGDFKTNPISPMNSQKPILPATRASQKRQVKVRAISGINIPHSNVMLHRNGDNLKGYLHETLDFGQKMKQISIPELNQNDGECLVKSPKLNQAAIKQTNFVLSEVPAGNQHRPRTGGAVGNRRKYGGLTSISRQMARQSQIKNMPAAVNRKIDRLSPNSISMGAATRTTFTAKNGGAASTVMSSKQHSFNKHDSKRQVWSQIGLKNDDMS